MGYRANYESDCKACGNRIMKGQLITWSRKGKKAVRHSDCRYPNAQEAPTPDYPVPTEVKTASPTPDPEPFEGGGSVPETFEEPEEEEEEPKAKENWDVPDKRRTPLELVVGEVKTKTATEQETSDRDALEQLATVLSQRIKSTGIDESKVVAIVNRLLTERNPLTVKVLKADSPDVVIENVHFHFPKLLYLVSKRHHVYMWGPPGSGKSTAAKQASESLTVPFGYISLNPMTPDSRLLGFIDAHGVYRKTVFRTIYEEGGVFCIDELDNASPSLLTTLNSMLECGVGAFPDAMIPRHENFVLVATGNTAGRGANPMFPERRPFDSAFAERFKYIAWEYDEKLERNIALGINPQSGKWVDWVQNLRRWGTAHLPRLVVSPRASFGLAEYTKDGVLTPMEMLDCLLWKGFDPESVQKALGANPIPS